MPTITGVAGSAINATCSVAADHAEINQTESSATAQAICNDLATIKSGSCTIAGTKTFSGGITLGAACVFTGTAGCSITGAFSLAAGCTITGVAGATLTGALGLGAGCTITGTAGCSLTGAIGLGASCTLTATAGAKIAGEIEYPAGSTVNQFGWTRIPEPDILSDADHQLVTGTTKQHVHLTTSPAAARVITLPEAAAWAALTGYTSGVDYVTNGGKLYICSQTGTSASSGGPTGTGTNITDATCKWDYVSPAPVEGDWYEITCLLGNSAFPIQIQRLSNLGTNVAMLTNSVFSTPGSNNTGSVRVRFDGTNWRGHFAGGGCASGGDW